MNEIQIGFLAFIVVLVIALIIAIVGSRKKKEEALEEPTFNTFQDGPTMKDPEIELDPVQVFSAPDYIDDTVEKKPKKAKKATAKKPRKKKTSE